MFRIAMLSFATFGFTVMNVFYIFEVKESN